MGLDFSHCNACWGYMGFNRFRKRLAAEAGIQLEAMAGFNSGHPGALLGESRRGYDRVPLSWGNVCDPIRHLLNHSDCDGHLTPAQCAAVIPRLKRLIADWPDDFDKKQAMELIRGMRVAVRRGENLEFQ